MSRRSVWQKRTMRRWTTGHHRSKSKGARPQCDRRVLLALCTLGRPKPDLIVDVLFVRLKCFLCAEIAWIIRECLERSFGGFSGTRIYHQSIQALESKYITMRKRNKHSTTHLQCRLQHRWCIHIRPTYMFCIFAIDLFETQTAFPFVSMSIARVSRTRLLCQVSSTRTNLHMFHASLLIPCASWLLERLDLLVFVYMPSLCTCATGSNTHEHADPDGACIASKEIN